MGDSLSYRYRYRFVSVWVDADVEYVGSVGDTVIVSSRYSGFISWLSRVDLPGGDSTLGVNLSLGSGSAFSLSRTSLTIPGSGVIVLV